MKPQNTQNANKANKVDRYPDRDKQRYIKIRTAMFHQELRMVDIAKELGMRPASVQKFVEGTRKSRRFDDWVRDNLKIAI